MIRIIIEIDEERDGTSPTLARILEEILKMSEQTDRLRTDVANLTTVDQSAAALITGLAQQIRDNASDPTALAAIADSLEASTADLAAAVAANTPAASPPPPPPPASTADAGAGAGTTADAGAGTADAGAGTGTDVVDPSAASGDGTVTEPPVDPGVTEPPATDPTV